MMPGMSSSANERVTPLQTVRNAWPWNTSEAHEEAEPCQSLREFGEYMATGGRGMAEDKLARIRAWLLWLRGQNLVLEFDPDLPPVPGVSPSGGFAYRPRTTNDDDLLIRVNGHTNLSEEGAMIWRWPPELPSL